MSCFAPMTAPVKTFSFKILAKPRVVKTSETVRDASVIPKRIPFNIMCPGIQIFYRNPCG